MKVQHLTTTVIDTGTGNTFRIEKKPEDLLKTETALKCGVSTA